MLHNPELLSIDITPYVENSTAWNFVLWKILFKVLYRARSETQWQSTCLACTQLQVPSPAPARACAHTHTNTNTHTHTHTRARDLQPMCIRYIWNMKHKWICCSDLGSIPMVITLFIIKYFKIWKTLKSQTLLVPSISDEEDSIYITFVTMNTPVKLKKALPRATLHQMSLETAVCSCSAEGKGQDRGSCHTWFQM
jgi:hypothetical protein